MKLRNYEARKNELLVRLESNLDDFNFFRERSHYLGQRAALINRPLELTELKNLVRFGFVNQKNDCMVVGKIRSYQELVDKQLQKYSKRGTG